MKINSIKCDFCGCDIFRRDGYNTAFSFRVKEKVCFRGWIETARREKYDLCYSCLMNMQEYCKAHKTERREDG